MECKHKWMFVNGITKRLRCTRCAELSFNLGLIDRTEDEEFERMEKRKVEDDDDIQDYKRPWVGLTDEERDDIILNATSKNKAVAKAEAKLKEKNT